MPENLDTPVAADITPNGVPAGAPEAAPEPAFEATPEPPPETASELAAESPPSEEQPATPAEETATQEPETPAAATAPPSNKRWYVVKVQSGREDTIKEAIERRVKIEGLEEYYGQIIIPVEHVTEMRNNKRVKKEHKLYPGYLMVEVEYNDRILYLFRETSGVGDFVGGTVNRPPPPMTDREVEQMTRRHQQTTGVDEPIVPGRTKISKPKFGIGDRLRVVEGTFAGMEGEVKEIMEEKGQVKLELTIFGRPVAVELEYWQVERA
jgi:transcription termination/antitermination protein NusG